MTQGRGRQNVVVVTQTTPNGGVAAGYYRIKGLGTGKGTVRLQPNRFDNRDFPIILASKARVLWGRTAFEFRGFGGGKFVISVATLVSSLTKP
jgi:hypothetical protein